MDNVSGTAGNDTIKATAATMGSLDTVDAGAGVDTLSIVDAGDVLTQPVTFTGLERMEVSAVGSIGAVAAGSAATPAVREIDQLSFAARTLDVVTFTGASADTGDTIKITNGTAAADTTYTYSAVTGKWSDGTNSYDTALAAVAAGLNARVAGSAAVGTDGKLYTTNDITGTAPASAAYNLVWTEASGTSVTAPSLATQDADALVQGGTFTVTYAGVTVTTAALGASPTKTDAAGLIAGAINAIAGGTVATVIGEQVVVTAPVAGTALPAYTITYAPAAGVSGSTFNSLVAKTDSVANAAAGTSTAQSAATFATSAADTSVVLSAGDEIVASAASTASVKATSGSTVRISGGADVTVTAGDSVQLSSGTGAISVTVASAAALSSNLAASSTTGWLGGAAGAGIFVRGGTSVTISQNDGVWSSGAYSDFSDNSIQVGANPVNASGTNGAGSSGTGAIATATATGYPEVIGNRTSAPTGDVSVTVRSTGTDTSGYRNVHYGAGDVKVFMNGGSTASVTGANSVTITDIQTTLTKSSSTADALPGVSKLTTVNLTGIRGGSAAATVNSDAIQAINVSDSSASVTVNSNTGANTGNIALSAGNSTVTLSHANATSVTVTGTAGGGFQKVDGNLVTSTASTVTLTTGKATSLAFAGSGEVTLAASTLSALKSITSTASGTLNLGTLTSYGKLTSVDLSGGTGSVTATIGATIASTLTPATDYGFAYVGSGGADVVALTGAMKSGTNALGAAISNTINLGGGNDLLLRGHSNAAIQGGSAVSGGDGIDTIAASLLNSGNAAQITGFEVLGLDLTSGTYDAALLPNAIGLAMLARGGTYTNVVTNEALSIVMGVGFDTNPSTTVTTLNFGTAVAAGTADAYSVTFATSAPTSTAANRTDADAGVLDISGIESVSLVSGGTGFINNQIRLVDTSARTLTLSGAQNLTVHFGGTINDDSSATNFFGTTGTSADSNGVSLIDASAMTGRLTIDTTDVGVAFVGLTVNGGSAADTVTLAGKATVNLGAGDDVLTAVDATTVTLGAGRDVVNVHGTAITVGATLATEAEATAKLVTIRDFSVGDSLDFVSGSNTGGSASAVSAITPLSATSLEAALNALADATATISWGQYGGNTYIVFDASSSTSGGLDTSDIVVKLDGLVDLSNSVFNTTTGIFTFG